jgi:hypothetical protein
VVRRETPRGLVAIVGQPTAAMRDQIGDLLTAEAVRIGIRPATAHISMIGSRQSVSRSRLPPRASAESPSAPPPRLTLIETILLIAIKIGCSTVQPTVSGHAKSSRPVRVETRRNAKAGTQPLAATENPIGGTAHRVPTTTGGEPMPPISATAQASSPLSSATNSRARPKVIGGIG